MISKLLLIIIALIQLGFGFWAATQAFKDVSDPSSALAMMGMFGSLFHSLIIFASLYFPVNVRRVITLLLVTWHLPEAILIFTFGMGVPEGEQFFGILMHTSFAVLALLSWWLAKIGK